MENTVTTQPLAQDQHQKIVTERTPTLSTDDAIKNLVTKISLSDCANNLFWTRKPDGKSLVLLNDEHLKEMGIKAIGGKVYLFQLLSSLKRKCSEQQTPPLWRAETIAEKNDVCCIDGGGWVGTLQGFLCPWWSSRVGWEVNTQGVFATEYSAEGCDWGRGGKSEPDGDEDNETEFIDFRFIQDIKMREDHLCCSTIKKLDIYYLQPPISQNEPQNELPPQTPQNEVQSHTSQPKGQLNASEKDGQTEPPKSATHTQDIETNINSRTERSGGNEGQSTDERVIQCRSIVHPDVQFVENVLRDAWSTVKQTSDEFKSSVTTLYEKK